MQRLGMKLTITLLIFSTFIIAGVLFAKEQKSAIEEGSEIIVDESTPEFEKITFGHSKEGRPIIGYVIGEGEETLFFFGGIHGNERGTVTLLNKLTREIQKSPELLSPNKQIVILPLANPDGYYTREDKLNANEVNVNRNFETQGWETFEDAEPDEYAGPAPFSEIESQIIKNIVETYNPNLMIAFHSQGGLVVPETIDESITLAEWYAEKTGYKYYNEWLYVGTATLWFEETTGQPGITVELTSHENDDWEINREALLELIR